MDKKLYNQSFIFMMVGIFAGAFYREFTQFLGFNGPTSMSIVHTHLLTTGAIIPLAFAILIKTYQINVTDKLERSWLFYIIGVIGNAGVMFTRGLFEVLNWDITRTVNMSFSGISGIAHILLTIGIIWFMAIIKRQINESN